MREVKCCVGCSGLLPRHSFLPALLFVGMQIFYFLNLPGFSSDKEASSECICNSRLSRGCKLFFLMFLYGQNKAEVTKELALTKFRTQDCHKMGLKHEL